MDRERVLFQILARYLFPLAFVATVGLAPACGREKGGQKEPKSESTAAMEKRSAKSDSSLRRSGTKKRSASRESANQVLGGTRVLLAFDDHGHGLDEDVRRAKTFDKTLAKSNIKIIQQYRRHNRYLLLDLGGLPVRRTLAKLPGHAGAMVFRDGQLIKCIPSPINGAMPEPYPVLRWGSSLDSAKRMDTEVARYEKMKGVRVDMLSSVPIGELENLGGNPWHLRLTLTPNSSMSQLSLFLEAKGEFLSNSYVDTRLIGR